MLSGTRAPHIVFALVDDWGSADAAFVERRLGLPPVLHTPRLDELAEEGVQMTNYYTQHICSPSRTALLSGRYQIHTGLQDGIIQAWARVCLPPKFGTVADALRALGYRTVMVGKWHAGIYRDACLPWNRGFEQYFGFLTGSEHHYTKIQRIARGSPGNASHLRLYPDLRTQDGPVTTHCIDPPLAPPPPPPTPCGGGSPQPPCNYSAADGYLPAGDDAALPANLTLPDARARCDALAGCEALTFRGTAASCTRAPCRIYLKASAEGLSGGESGWLTLFKHAPPHSSQGDPSCYSSSLFGARAVRAVREHDASDAAHPLFLYLALQDVHEPVEVPRRYYERYDASIRDCAVQTSPGCPRAAPVPPHRRSP